MTTLLTILFLLIMVVLLVVVIKLLLEVSDLRKELSATKKDQKRQLYSINDKVATINTNQKKLEKLENDTYRAILVSVEQPLLRIEQSQKVIVDFSKQIDENVVDVDKKVVELLSNSIPAPKELEAFKNAPDVVIDPEIDKDISWEDLAKTTKPSEISTLYKNNKGGEEWVKKD